MEGFKLMTSASGGMLSTAVYRLLPSIHKIPTFKSMAVWKFLKANWILSLVRKRAVDRLQRTAKELSRP